MSETSGSEITAIERLRARNAELERLHASDDFWRNWVYTEGVPTADQIRAELADYHDLMDRVAIIYCHVTGDRLSKPTYTAEVICSAADEYYQRLHEESEKEIRQERDEAQERVAQLEIALKLALRQQVPGGYVSACLEAERALFKAKYDAAQDKLRELNPVQGYERRQAFMSESGFCNVCGKSAQFGHDMTAADHAPNCLAWGSRLEVVP